MCATTETVLGWETVDPLGDDGWDRMVRTHPGHSVFHLQAWARVLSESYGHQPSYLSFFDDRETVALLPMMEVASALTGRRAVSLPFSDFAGPLMFQPGVVEGVVAMLPAIAVARGWRHLEVRGLGTSEAGTPRRVCYVGHELDLSRGLSEIEAGLKASTRRAIRKSAQSGLTLTIDREPDTMRSFYRLHSRTRRRHGLPPQPPRFFDAIVRHLFSEGLGEVAMAHLDGTPVAGAVFLRAGRRAIYKFGASETEAWPLRPNQAVMWHAIKHLVEQGCEALHFGRTSESDVGLQRFKASWGARATLLDYYRYDVRQATWLPPRPAARGTHRWLFGGLPLSLNRLAGQLIYPHLD